MGELDSCLLSYYDLPDSQMTTQNDENINCNGNVNELEREKEKEDKEKEWPACKKRKLPDENITDIAANKKVLTEKSNLGKEII